MKVGLFDHVEAADRPLATLFDERLAFAKAADEAGIYCLHVAEHHATPLNMVPVPGVYLGAVARATTRLRDAMRLIMQDSQVTSVFEKAGSPPAYLDQPDFIRFVEADAARLIPAVKKIGRLDTP